MSTWNLQSNAFPTPPAPMLVSDWNANLQHVDPLRGDLAEQEAIIAGGLQSYEEIGKALRTIRDGRLYRTYCKTFEQYCLDRWGFKRQTAYDYIKAATVAENVADVRMSVQIDLALSQAVELALLKPAQQREVVDAIFAEGRNLVGLSIFKLRNVVYDVKRGRAASDAVRHFISEADDQYPPLKEKGDTTSRRGDLWVLGDHRLFVGDATDPFAITELMREERADMVFTDPPYRAKYTGKTEDRLTIIGDDIPMEEYKDLLAKAFRSYASVVKPTASLYLFHASAVQREFQDALEAAKFEIRTQLIWKKNQPVLSRSRFNFRHEPFFYCHVVGRTDEWFGDPSEDTVWEFDKPTASRDHPTMKPVELIQHALTLSSKAGNIVVDLFGGSGSTLIACELERRRARLMEIDPQYADVIVQRWQELTGKAAVLENDGRSFDEIARLRSRMAA